LLLVAGGLGASAQSLPKLFSTDLTVYYSVERARIVNTPCECFWLEGASAETGFTVYKNIAAAVEITGGHVSNIGSGVNLGKFALMAGPRYTAGVSRWTSRFTRTNQTAIFGEALFGVAHAFDSIFPSSLGSNNNSTSSSMQLGGGLDLSLRRGLSLRAPEVDYVRTAFPNNGSNTQNDLKLSLGVSWRFPSAAQPH
jgi:hypothetical protein